MSLKMKLAEALDWIVKVEGLSYTQVSSKTGLSRSQVYNVIKKQGDGVSSDKIWEAIMKLDGSTKIELSTENERLIP
jgi:predicted XRE-type DNA-binding protein